MLEAHVYTCPGCWATERLGHCQEWLDLDLFVALNRSISRETTSSHLEVAQIVGKVGSQIYVVRDTVVSKPQTS